MMLKLNPKSSLLAITLTLSCGSALAGPLGSAEIFNAYATGYIDYGSVDIEGVVGSGGDISFVGGDVGRYNYTSEYSMYAGGSVSLEEHHVYNGGVEAGGDVELYDLGMSVFGAGFATNDAHKIRSGNNVMGNDGTVGDIYASGSITAGGGLNHGSLNPGSSFSPSIDHDQVSADIESASQAYAATAATGTATDHYGKLIFSGGNALNIFDINAQALSDAHTWEFSGLGTYVLNILGDELELETFSGFNFIDGATSDMLLYNFIEAELLDIRGSLHGTVLAPLANTFLDGSGTLYGSIYTDELEGRGQINAIAFNGVGAPSPVPSPATLPLLLAGLAGMFWQSRRKRA